MEPALFVSPLTQPGVDFAALADHGFQRVPHVLPSAWTNSLRTEAERLAAQKSDASHGIRDLLHKSPLIRSLLREPWLQRLIPKDYICVRGILFDKTPGRNWLVAWHQDLTICVREKRDLPNYGPWSIKHDIPHVQPPMSLLDAMVTVRLHLDDAGPDNGALRVIPGSHQHGRLDAAKIESWRTTSADLLCTVKAGDALLMRPLLLHASSRATSPAHRRVIHLEFAPENGLHEQLNWYEPPV